MTETATMALNDNLEFLDVTEVGKILKVTRITVYRLIAKQTLPVYRACKKFLFKKADVVDYLERSRSGPPDPEGYGGTED